MATKKEKFKDMNATELEKKLAGMEESLRTIRFKAEGAKSKNVKEGKGLRKQIAQIMTILNQNKKQAVK